MKPHPDANIGVITKDFRCGDANFGQIIAKIVLLVWVLEPNVQKVFVFLMKVKETEREIEGWKDRQTDRQTEKQKDSKTMKRERDRQTE